MRDLNRLDMFYDEVKKIHKVSFPDWRFGQLISNFFSWMSYEKRRDCFFSEEEDMIGYLKEFANEVSSYCREWHC